MANGQEDLSIHARELSKRGAVKGGLARSAGMTPEERRELARQGAAARWNRGVTEGGEEGIQQATFGTPDRPLKLGGTEIPCYVVEQADGKVLRLVVMAGMLKALNISLGGSSGRLSGSRLSRFVASKALKPFVNEELVEKVNNPILFRTPSGGIAYGYEGSTLADICDVVLEARGKKALNRQQEHIADQALVLVRGWARVGLSALIDEVTGYQYYRSRRALEEILDRYISKELRKWTKTFPDDFYEEMFRLRGWRYSPFTVKRPTLVGKFTMDVVYKRLAPGVLEELQKITPRDAKGRLAHRYHQRLTEDVGHPKLREHLAATTALMRAADDWIAFLRMLNRAFPKLNTNLPLPLP